MVLDEVVHVAIALRLRWRLSAPCLTLTILVLEDGLGKGRGGGGVLACSFCRKVLWSVCEAQVQVQSVGRLPVLLVVAPTLHIGERVVV